MAVRPNTGWQMILTDLAMILFMISASALSSSVDGPAGTPARAAPVASAPAPRPVEESARAEPVGVWSDGPGAPPLAQWLTEQGSDPRLRATIVVRYQPGGRPAAFTLAEALTAAAGERGRSARVVVEPGQSAGASATVGYDQDQTGR